MHWIFVGAGNMASSLIGGLIASGAIAESITVVDPQTDACERAKTRFGIKAESSLENALADNKHQTIGLVLAVKPHIVETVCSNFKDFFNAQSTEVQSLMAPVVISVAAGVRASSMEQWLPQATALVRCMPNTPALLGLGATALFANPSCTNDQKSSAESLLKAAGMTLWVEKEQQLDAVTALSGSGPAYFFYLIEQMSAAGTALGLDEKTASELAIETAFGASSMARAREHSPSVLRENVTSKGGTTAAALNSFNKNNLPALVAEGMQAAHDRAVELGDDLAPGKDL